jgi:hypothetical protein
MKSGEAGGGADRRRGEQCLWVTKTPCVAGFGVGKAPARSPDGAREMRPWRCAFRRRDGRG